MINFTFQISKAESKLQTNLCATSAFCQNVLYNSFFKLRLLHDHVVHRECFWFGLMGFAQKMPQSVRDLKDHATARELDRRHIIRRGYGNSVRQHPLGRGARSRAPAGRREARRLTSSFSWARKSGSRCSHGVVLPQDGGEAHDDGGQGGISRAGSCQTRVPVRAGEERERSLTRSA